MLAMIIIMYIIIPSAIGALQMEQHHKKNTACLSKTIATLNSMFTVKLL